MCVSECVGAHAHGHTEARGHVEYSTLSFSVYSFKTGSLSETGPKLVASNPQQSSGSCPCAALVIQFYEPSPDPSCILV